MAERKEPKGRGRKSPAKGPSRGGALDIPPPDPVSVDPPAPKAAVSLAVAEGAAPPVQTIVYIHGIGNKPAASVLKCQWDSALFGVQLGDRSRMAYWCNREYYPVPEDVSCAAGDVVRIEDDEATTKAIMALAAGRTTDERDAIDREIGALTDDPARRQWLHRLSGRMVRGSEVDEGALRVASAQVGAKVLPLPPFLRRLVARQLVRAFLRDVNDFLFHKDRRERMIGSLAERLEAGGGPFVVIAHSQGSMVAYEVLRHLTKAQCDVRLLVTIGSPLGLAEVQDVFRQWVGGSRLPVPKCVDRWVNVADRLDPVSLDTDISNDFAPKGRIENHSGLGVNDDSPRHPHSGTGYLRTRWVRDAVRETVGNAFGQAVARAILTKDLVADLEDGLPATRHKTLIQLAADAARGGSARGGHLTLAEMGDRLTGAIESMVEAGGQPIEVANIERMRRFVAADLTRQEAERLRTLFADLQIERVWRNMQKRTLIHASTHTVQVRPANLGYGATGRDIGWAVLDTGIRADHPHFERHGNVVRQWDCTVRGAPAVKEPGDEGFDGLDRNGHGTHVAAIIAGCHGVPRERGGVPVELAGMAPEAKLYGFKVLDDRGNGHDSYIIKALDLIAELNEAAGRLVIQGVNVSLGGNFDPSVYGCGHTPLCQELRRLWRQGALVCLAAGNEGYAMLQGAEGELPANMDLSIGDPANMEEAIAVGSVHKTNPHTYGVSFFSSRGPTADGRRKPDLVAPGEQILSAYHGWPNDRAADGGLTRDELYVEMSGTSMATPHVSGLLAAFLSVRREFIGYPDRVKALLLEHCTDLRRDPYIQGAGMPNLIKMLANC